MKKTFLYRLYPGLSAMGLIGLLMSKEQALYAQAETKTGVQQAVSSLEAAGKTGAGLPDADPSIIIGSLLGTALSFVGVLFLLLMIYAGVLWMTARGNEADVKKAKDMIIAAIIGLVIIFSAYAITAYIGSAIEGS